MDLTREQVTDLEVNPFEAIETGDDVIVDAQDGIVTVKKVRPEGHDWTTGTD